jgi:DNA mismatch endonuclease, patch repair protein
MWWTDKETRTRIMRANRGKDTSPELAVRKALFARGFRYHLHSCRLPGKPDIVLSKYHAVVFVHGCYWHGHNCKRRPHAKSNIRFWRNKLDTNKKRDSRVISQLLETGWRVLVIWECAVRRHTPPFAVSDELERAVTWLLGRGKYANISEDGFEECL